MGKWLREKKWHQRWKYASLPTRAILWHCERFDASSKKTSKWSTVFLIWCFGCHRYHQWIISSRQNKRNKGRQKKQKSRQKEEKKRRKRKEGKKTLDGGMNEKETEHISSRIVVNAKQSLWYTKVEQKKHRSCHPQWKQWKRNRLRTVAIVSFLVKFHVR